MLYRKEDSGMFVWACKMSEVHFPPAIQCNMNDSESRDSLMRMRAIFVRGKLSKSCIPSR